MPERTADIVLADWIAEVMKASTLAPPLMASIMECLASRRNPVGWQGGRL